MNMRSLSVWVSLMAPVLITGCIGGKGSATNTTPPPPVVNTLAITVDAGPPLATSTINKPYVTVKVCAPGSTTQCATIDHVLVDTGSWGLRLVHSVMAAPPASLSLTPETDATGQTLEECLHLGGGDTWGPVALADVTLAGEVAAKVPIQVLDDDAKVGASPPATCGPGNSFKNAVSDLNANGLLGVGVFAQDCGSVCVAPATTPLPPAPPQYYGCTAAGTCTAEFVPLTAQVTNPVAMFAADNNGLIVNLPNLQNANGDLTLTGEMVFGLGTQTDNVLPVTALTVLGADPGTGDFMASYNSGMSMPSLIDSGADDYSFDDPSIPTCTTGSYVGYYCPLNPPLVATVVNTGATTAAVPSISNTVSFAIDDPNSFQLNATAVTHLGGGKGSTRFTWGMPYFYGRPIYIGLDKKTSGSFTGPFYAY